MYVIFTRTYAKVPNDERKKLHCFQPSGTEYVNRLQRVGGPCVTLISFPKVYFIPLAGRLVFETNEKRSSYLIFYKLCFQRFKSKFFVCG